MAKGARSGSDRGPTLPDARGVLLDEHLPAYSWRERHAIHVAAPPAEVERALREVTAAEMPLVRALLALRSLPSRGRRHRTAGHPPDRPVLEEIARGGFILLGEERGREMVFGIVGRFWQPCPVHAEIAGPGAFRSFAEPGWAKAAMNFTLAAKGGGTRLSTETRIAATDGRAWRRFALYWTLVRPGSALIRRIWLRAVRARAEAGGAPASGTVE